MDDGSQIDAGTLSFIRSTPLSPIQHNLLRCFVENAVDPGAAASYLMNRVKYTPSEGHEEVAALSSFLYDWKQLCRRVAVDSQTSAAAKALLCRRENSKCFITVTESPRWDFFGRHKLQPAHIVPPSFLDIDEKHATQTEMLEAFLTSDRLATLRSHLSPASEPTLNIDAFQDERVPIVSKEERLDNLLLLCPSVKAAFKSARICLSPYRLRNWNKLPTLDPKLQNKFQLEWSIPGPYPDWLRYGGPKPRSAMFSVLRMNSGDSELLPPSIFLFSIHARFTQPLRWCNIEDEVALGLPSESSWSWNSLYSGIFSFLRTSWLLLPELLRLKACRLLLFFGSKIYRRETEWVQRVPFGLYIKHGHAGCVAEGEGAAMRLVEKHTKVPSPKLIDELQDGNQRYLIMTRMPGNSLKKVHHLMSYDQRERLLEDLSFFISQFRNIPNSTGHLICNAVGGPLYDSARLPNDSIGPFDNERDFNAALALNSAAKEAASQAHSRTHQIYFTHGDLSPINILVNDGKLSAIIDFGYSGYYPEYWEYTKLYPTFWGPIAEWIEDVTRVLGTEYQEELKAELALSSNRPGF